MTASSEQNTIQLQHNGQHIIVDKVAVLRTYRMRVFFSFGLEYLEDDIAQNTEEIRELLPGHNHAMYCVEPDVRYFADNTKAMLPNYVIGVGLQQLDIANDGRIASICWFSHSPFVTMVELQYMLDTYPIEFA